MSIEVVKIDDNQFDEILKFEESHFLDLKSIEIKPAKLTKSISGFANADGGELYIGISERTVEDQKIRFWKGFIDQESANGHIQIFEQLFPLGENYSYTFLTTKIASGLVLQVTIGKSREIVEASDGIPYIRRGAQNLPVKGEALERLKLDKGIESFERRTIDAELEILASSEIISKFIRNVIPSSEPHKWLKKQQLLKGDKPIIAGILLFSDEPQAIIPKRCGVKIYRYKTRDIEGTRDTLAFDPITVEGCLYKQIEEAVNITIETVERIPKVGDEGLESIIYPKEAIHEIITNAILHRDYSIVTDIQIRIFDNRIEVESPGKLPGHVTVKNILNEQYARNPVIVRIINKFPEPPNKDVGEGLNTAFQAMAKLRLKPPEICEKDNSLLVNIKHEPLASVEASVMKYLNNNDEITNKTARKITGIRSEGTIKQAFDKLRGKGLIELVPGKPKNKAAWRKPKNEDKQEDDLPNVYDLYPKYEQLVMEYLINNETITNKIGRKITNIESANTMTNIFKRLRKKGFLELIPGRRGINSVWRKIK